MLNNIKESIKFVTDMQFIANELLKAGNINALAILAKYDIVPTISSDNVINVKPAVPFEKAEAAHTAEIEKNKLSKVEVSLNNNSLPKTFSFDDFIKDETDKILKSDNNNTPAGNADYDIYLDSNENGGSYKLMKGSELIKEQKINTQKKDNEEVIALGYCFTSNKMLSGKRIAIHYHQEAVKNNLDAGNNDAAAKALKQHMKNIKYDLIAA